MAGIRHRGGAHVYVVMDGDGKAKIGRTSYPESRLKSLQGKDRKHLTMPYLSPNTLLAALVELRAQTLVADRFIKNEWFQLSCEEAKAAIEQAIVDVDNGWRAPKGIRGGGLPFHPSRVPPQDWPERWK